MPKAQRISPARTPSSEKARRAASAEIQQRLDALEAPQTADVAPTGEAAPEGGVTAKAGSPRPRAQTSGGKGGKGKKGKGAKPPKAEKPAKVGTEVVVGVDRRTPKSAVSALEPPDIASPPRPRRRGLSFPPTVTTETLMSESIDGIEPSRFSLEG